MARLQLVGAKDGLNVRTAAQELDANSQIVAAGRFWQLCVAQEMTADPALRPRPDTPTFLEDRRALALVAGAARRIVRLMFGVVLRDVRVRPDLFSRAIAELANNMAFEIGDNLSSFPLEERVRILEGLCQRMAQGLQIGLAQSEPESVQ